MKSTSLIEVRVVSRPHGCAAVETHGGVEVHFPQARRDALAAIKREALRLAGNGTREGHKFAERLFEAIPELRNV
jgi:hypothetical protein